MENQLENLKLNAKNNNEVDLVVTKAIASHGSINELDKLKH